jgi:hypothetical protein
LDSGVVEVPVRVLWMVVREVLVSEEGTVLAVVVVKGIISGF